MGRDLLLKDKRGVSVMVGYVLLVVMAIGLSVLVFAMLKLWVPIEKSECPEDISLTIESASCSGGIINMTLRNRGLFSIDSVFINIGEPDRVFRTLLNKETNFLFRGKPGLKLVPGDTWDYSKIYLESGVKELEIEPLLYVGDAKEPSVCDKSIVKKIVTCD